MGALEAIGILLALQFKHFLADFAFQTRNMVQNKGFYGHKDGLAHSAIHGLLSLIALFLVWEVSLFVIVICLVETIIHYHIDWFKERVTRNRSWSADNLNFWIAIGFDQFLHQTTYICLLVWIVTNS